MAEILIKNFKMPKDCNKCPFEKSKKEKQEYIWFCSLTNTECENVLIHNKDCPLVEVPPHGRLVDAELFLAETKDVRLERPIRNNGTEIIGLGELFAEFINNAPTVIEASTKQRQGD